MCHIVLEYTEIKFSRKRKVFVAHSNPRTSKIQFQAHLLVT